MKTCNGCKYAEWDRTKSGRLHPNKGGWCKFKIKMPTIPAAFYCLWEYRPCGGHIRRDEPFRDGKHCPCWEPEDSGRWRDAIGAVKPKPGLPRPEETLRKIRDEEV